MKNIALGKYLPLDSFIHKLDPRIKFMSMIFFMTSVFLVGGSNPFLAYGFLFAILVIAILSAKLKLSYVLKAMKPMVFMIVFLSIINMFAYKTGTVLVSIGSFKIYSDAIFNTLFIIFRLMLMIMITTLLTATTAPLDLTLGIEDLLSPFKRFGVPSHEIAMMISIALRFIPTLIEDTQRIMNAQSSRGVDFQEGTLKEKIVGVVSLIIPLFVSAYHRAEDLADAMEARGYSPGKTRTRYKQLKIRLKDIAVLMFSIALCFATFFIGRIA